MQVRPCHDTIHRDIGERIFSNQLCKIENTEPARCCDNLIIALYVIYVKNKLHVHVENCCSCHVTVHLVYILHNM